MSTSKVAGAELQAQQTCSCGWRRSARRQRGQSGIDFASGKRLSTTVLRAQRENSKGRVRRIRKIHSKSPLPLRQRLAQIARAAVSKEATA